METWLERSHNRFSAVASFYRGQKTFVDNNPICFVDLPICGIQFTQRARERDSARDRVEQFSVCDGNLNATARFARELAARWSKRPSSKLHAL